MAVTQAGKEKVYALPCPRCRQVNKIPIKQLRNNLPPGWTPPAPEGVEVTSESPAGASSPNKESAKAVEIAAEIQPPVKKKTTTKRTTTDKKTAK
jgi:hypothetical protein